MELDGARGAAGIPQFHGTAAARLPSRAVERGRIISADYRFVDSMISVDAGLTRL
jgi:hypothetical protein